MAADKEKELSSMAREDAGAMDIVNDMDSKLWQIFCGIKGYVFERSFTVGYK